MAAPTPDDILPTYERRGPAWVAQRSKSLFERPVLDPFLAHCPGTHILDLGCGGGDPIAKEFVRRGYRVTGVDGARSMVDLFAANLPGERVVHADMRTLSLGERFHGIIAFDSYFHLEPDDQRAMFAVFAAHAAPGAALLLTTGPEAGVAYGTVEGEPVYHASLAPAEYRALFAAHGFTEIAFRPEDPECDYHTVWIARHDGAA